VWSVTALSQKSRCTWRKQDDTASVNLLPGNIAPVGNMVVQRVAFGLPLVLATGDDLTATVATTNCSAHLRVTWFCDVTSRICFIAGDTWRHVLIRWAHISYSFFFLRSHAFRIKKTSQALFVRIKKRPLVRRAPHGRA
jgi:hypothetical protein